MCTLARCIYVSLSWPRYCIEFTRFVNTILSNSVSQQKLTGIIYVRVSDDIFIVISMKWYRNFLWTSFDYHLHFNSMLLWNFIAYTKFCVFLFFYFWIANWTWVSEWVEDFVVVVVAAFLLPPNLFPLHWKYILFLPFAHVRNNADAFQKEKFLVFEHFWPIDLQK